MSEQKNTISKKNIIIRWIIIITALLTAAALLTVSIVLLNKKQFPYSSDPIAKITLNNGMELYFELYADSAPLAVGNFVYRANNGYYNQTIIHNYKKTPDGGFYIESGKNYNASMTLKDKYSDREDMKFSVKKDSNSLGNTYLTKKYYLSTSLSNSNSRASSEFRICLKESSMTSDSSSIFGVVFGNAYDQRTKDNLDQLYNQILEDQTSDFNNGNNTPSKYISITGIKILTEKDYWKNFDYKKEWTKDQDYFLV
ncbi:MAG TPA: peptidylprolyl isomerase [Clostridia bacterium]